MLLFFLVTKTFECYFCLRTVVAKASSSDAGASGFLGFQLEESKVEHRSLAVLKKHDPRYYVLSERGVRVKAPPMCL